MSRIYDPLPDDHPLVGEPCGRCCEPFAPGDRTQLIPKPGGDRDGLTVEALPVHAECPFDIFTERTPSGKPRSDLA